MVTHSSILAWKFHEQSSLAGYLLSIILQKSQTQLRKWAHILRNPGKEQTSPCPLILLRGHQRKRKEMEIQFTQRFHTTFSLPHISKNKLTSQRKSWFINRHSPLPSICQLVKAGIGYMIDDQTVMDISAKFMSVCHVLLSKENNYFKTYIYVAKQNQEKNYISSQENTFQFS